MMAQTQREQPTERYLLDLNQSDRCRAAYGWFLSSEQSILLSS